MMTRSARYHARQRDYQGEIDTHFGTKPRPAKPPCPLCKHPADAHAFGGPCLDCDCKGIPVEVKPVASNPYQEKARLEKAEKLTLLCREWNIRSYDVAGWSDTSWRMLADAATARFKTKVNPPREESQALVIKMLREHELAGAAALERDRR